jgi:hypothetical protein
LSLELVLHQIVNLLDNAGIHYMLTGSFAGSYHGIPRSTHDIDLVIDSAQDQIERFVNMAIKAGFYASHEAAREAVSVRGQFNVIDRSTGWKIDLILRKDRPFSREEFRRRTLQNVFGLTLYVVTPEDTILAKLEWYRMGQSEQQLRDVAGIIQSQRGRLDEQYIQHWADELDVVDQWETAQKAAGS